MTNRDAIFVLKTMDETYTGTANREALKLAIAALEKQEPVEPEYHKCKAGNYMACPKCGWRGVADLYGDYCNQCGQLIKRIKEGTE